jgi:hypothetical protein
MMPNVKQDAKLAYAQPQLTVYGGFSQLTAAGSSGNLEGMAMTSMMRMA